MNAQERKALNRAILSQEKWRNKAKERQKGIRLQQLTIRDLERSRANWRARFFRCKDELFQQIAKEKQTALQKTSESENRPAIIERKKN